MSIPNEIEQLRLFLSERSSFCVVYRIISSLGGAVEIEFLCAVSAYGHEHSELAAAYSDIALRRARLDKDCLISFDTIRPPNREGRRWQGVVIATGPTRAAGYIIVFAASVKDPTETLAYIDGVQRVMRGEEARSVPRPDDW